MTGGTLFAEHTHPSNLADSGTVTAGMLAPDAAGGLAPTGALMAYAGSAAPTGWLLCDGTAVSRAVYARLFAAVSTAYGAGDGGTTFNVPNLKGRVPVGRDAADADWDALGELRGAKTVALTTAEVASHGHTQDAHSHIHGHTTQVHGHTVDAHSHGGGTGVHAHQVQVKYNTTNTAHDHNSGAAEYAGAPTGGSQALDNGLANTNNAGVANTSDTPGTSFPNVIVNGDNSASTATNQTAGSGTAHTNLQPSIVLNYIIRI